MMVMCGQSNQIWHYWAGKYPGSVGHLFGPKNMSKQALRKWMPFACDNDAYIAYSNGQEWDAGAWFKMLERVALTRLTPLWVLVPDVVADRAATLRQWYDFSPSVIEYGWPLAFAAQDGMTPADVPGNADVVFIGGTTEWKWRSVPAFCEAFPRVHVGRVNEVWRLDIAERHGAESVDGTGWFKRGAESERFGELERWMEGHRANHPELEFAK